MKTIETDQRYRKEYSEETAMDFFTDALKYAEEDDECLSLQDAIHHSGIPYSTFYYLADSYKSLEKIKSDIQQAIIRRVNKGALKDNLVSTPAIWRMKQLGERDQQNIDHTTGGQPFSRKPYEDVEPDSKAD